MCWQRSSRLGCSNHQKPTSCLLARPSLTWELCRRIFDRTGLIIEGLLSQVLWIVKFSVLPLSKFAYLPQTYSFDNYQSNRSWTATYDVSKFLSGIGYYFWHSTLNALHHFERLISMHRRNPWNCYVSSWYFRPIFANTFYLLVKS